MQTRPHVDELIDQFVDMLYVSHWLKTRSVERAIRSAPRHIFVDRMHSLKGGRLIRVDPRHPTAHQLQRIYTDEALVSHRNPPSSTSQPSLVTYMLEALRIRRGNRILEIGAGTGWNAALMGHLAGPRGHVHTVDIQARVASRARRHLARAGVGNVTVVTGDGAKGFPRGAPYDRIVTTVGCPDISPAWIEQLKDRGRLLVTLNDLPGDSFCLLAALRKHRDHLRGEVIMLPGFMHLTGRDGIDVPSSRRVEDRLRTLRAGHRRSKKRAPWAAANVGKRQWMKRDLLFFASLEGMTVEWLNGPHLVSAPGADGICLAEEESIEICGGDASYRRLGEITRKWIDLGAPPRDSYLLDVFPRHTSRPRPQSGWVMERQHSRLVFRLKPSFG